MADELIDEAVAALTTTKIIDAKVFEYIAKLSCFYGTNVRAFLVLTVSFFSIFLLFYYSNSLLILFRPMLKKLII